MATVSVAVLGLGRVGASMVLALRRYNARKDAGHQFAVTAADTRAGVRDDASKLGLSERIERDPVTAARDKDIVVIALPYADVQAGYQEIGGVLRSGAVVLDASPLKLPSLEWARKYVREGAHMIGIAPVINARYLFDGLDDTEHAQADLFDGGNLLLMPASNAVKEAVELASDFGMILGAQPHFFDAAEHDSLIALTEGLPALLGLIVYRLASTGAGWSDVQRVTNAGFGRLTHRLYDTHPDDLRDLWLGNRDALLPRLDALMTELSDFRSALAHNDRPAIESALEQASQSYSAWINRRVSSRWEDVTQESSPSSGSMLMSGLMGGFLARRLRGEKDSDR